MYKCNDCSYSKNKLFFQCPVCKSRNIDEFDEKSIKATPGLKAKSSLSTLPKKGQKIQESVLNKKERLQTGIKELDRVLGGGFIDKEVVLFAAAPGTGKSTLSMQISGKIAEKGKNVMYFSGEETEEQVAERAKRLNIDSPNISIVHSSNLDEILSSIAHYKPDFFIVDSIQMVATESIAGSMGSISQSKEAANSLTNMAKNIGSIAVLISQVNKGEEFAGSMFVQHVVDCLLFFEGSKDTPLKFLRTFKNRYGSTDEVGIFQHGEAGLEEVIDPSGVFLNKDEDEAIGSSLTVITEGKRAIIAEIQALTVASSSSRPRQQINNLDYNRAILVSAVLDKYLKKGISSQDVFISTSNGIKVYDTTSDLSIAASLISSLENKPLSESTVFIGEISLSGFIRGNNTIIQKVKEAERLGIKNIIIPNGFKDKIKKSNSRILEVKTIKELDYIIRNK